MWLCSRRRHSGRERFTNGEIRGPRVDLLLSLASAPPCCEIGARLRELQKRQSEACVDPQLSLLQEVTKNITNTSRARRLMEWKDHSSARSERPS
jgi:hypothetical protein